MVRKKIIASIMMSAMILTTAGENVKVYANVDDYSSLIESSTTTSIDYAQDSNGLLWGYHKLNDGTIALDGTVKYEYDNGTRFVVGDDQLKSVIEIPSQLNGYKVSAVISVVGYENRMLGYGKLGKRVEKIVVPEGVKEICEGAFGRCPNLNEVVIPSTVNIISSASFPQKWLDAHRDSDGFIIINGILVDGHKASGDVTIPEGIRCIGDGAFAEYYDLDDYVGMADITSIKIPKSVKRIGKYAFSKCNLNKVEIEDGVEIIDDNAFTGCVNLKEVDIPASVVKLSSYAFDSDCKLKNRDNSSSNDNLVISNGVLLKGNNAKGDVVIPSNVTTIQKGAFEDNKDITSVTIPSNVKAVSDMAFARCSNLKKVKIEKGIEIIGESAFEQTGIESINIPEGVSVKSKAFSDCENLKEVSYKEGTDVNLNAFSYTPWVESLKDENGLCIYNHGVLKYVTDGKTEEIIIPDGITEIGEFAFSNGLQNENIKKVKLPEGVKKIGKFAFSECRNMTEIYIPSTVKTIEYGAFDFCGELKFSGPGAQMAKYEKENGYPTAKAAGKAADSKTYDSKTYDNNTSQSASTPLENVQNSQDKINPGWNLINDYWYYGNSDGTKFTGWLYYNGSWYYFYGNGQMATGFIRLGGDYYYYLDETITSSIGIMKTGWQFVGGYWFYFNRSSDQGIEGMMNKGGWRNIDRNWYYFYSDGKMARNTWIDGYYVNNSGAWVD